ncbi:MAG: hypothetical protein AAF664_04310 [Planctomycetota bacterium]
MSQTNHGHFSNALAAVQRTERLPGGDVRGLPNGRVIGGLNGLQSFVNEFSEAEKEFQQGRVHSALDRVKQIEARFHASADHWNAIVGTLLNDIRQGKQLKNLEKLNHLKSAQVNMQRLISTARKSLQDLSTMLNQDAVNAAREDKDETV